MILFSAANNMIINISLPKSPCEP